MARLRQLMTSFASGEVDPLMHSRSDVKSYFNAAATLLNVQLRAEGGVERRPGTYYVATLPGQSRLIAFEYRTDQRYLLVLSNARLDVYSSAGALLQTITSLDWTTSLLSTLRWTIAGDSIFVCHPTMRPQKILRTGASTFTVSDLTFVEGTGGVPRRQPYHKFAATADTLTPSATTGSINLISSAAYFEAGHVGRIIRYAGKEIEITAFTDPTHVDGDVLETLPATTATTDWDEEAWSDLRGWPRCAVYHDQRLWMAGTDDLPNGIWSSKVGDYFNFDTGTGLDDESIAVVLVADKVPVIEHLVSSRNLQIFTSIGEYYVPQSESAPITPGNFSARRQTPYGVSTTASPVLLDGATLFVQRTGKSIREFLYTETQGAYTSEAVSLLASHLLSNPVAFDVQYGTGDRQEHFAFVVNDDGSLAVFHSLRSEQSAGWVRWATGSGLFKDLAVLEDDVFCVTLRGAAWQLELFAADQAESCLDNAETVTPGGTVSVFPGFTHLAGQTVAVTTPGYALGDYTVSGGGVITLTGGVTATEITAGVDYGTEIKTLPPTLALRTGPTDGQMRRLIACFVDLVETYAVSVQGYNLIVRNTIDDMSLPPNALTGYRRFFLGGYDRRGQVTLTQAVPLPLTLRSLIVEVLI